MDKWIANLVGKMHINKITQIELADKVGCTREYITMILNGKKTPKGVEERLTSAVDEIISERKSVKV